MKSILVVAFILVPLSVQASWWNPKDWVPKPEPEIREVIKEVPKEVVVVKEVVKKVSYDNPKLLKDIELLKAENAQLAKELDDVYKKNNTLTYTNASQRVLNNTYAESYEKLKAAYDNTYTAYQTVYKAYQEDGKLISMYREAMNYCKAYMGSAPSVSNYLPKKTSCTISNMYNGVDDIKTVECY